MEDQTLYIRKISAKPGTFNDRTRSVRVIAATETPIQRFDFLQQKWICVIHLLDGIVLPPSGQVPLLDSHDRTTVASVLGSARNFSVSGSNLECDVFFSGTEAGKNAAQKVKEGHLTDFSVSYVIIETFWIPEGETKEIRGRIFKGPLRVNSRWRLIELSIAAIGADQNAKVINEKKRDMPADSVTGNCSDTSAGASEKQRNMSEESQVAETCSDMERGITEKTKELLKTAGEKQEKIKEVLEKQEMLKTLLEKKEPLVKTVTGKRKYSFVDIAFISFLAMMVLMWLFGIF